MADAYITLDELRKFGACRERYRHLMRNIEYEPAEMVCIPLKLILDVNGPADALWAWWSLHDYSLFSIPDVTEDERRFLTGNHDAMVKCCSDEEIAEFTRWVRKNLEGLKR